MTPCHDLLTDYCNVPEIAICAANNSMFAGVGQSTLHIELDTTLGHKKVLLLPDVIYAPGMAATLVSFSKLNLDGLMICIHTGTMHIHGYNSRLAGTIPCNGCLYTLRLDNRAPYAATATPVALTLYKLHQHLGHCNYQTILSMACSKWITGFTLTDGTQVECTSCALLRASRVPIAAARQSPSAAAFGNHLHSDVWGPALICTLQHKRYTLVLVDDATRWIEALPMKQKSDTLGRYISFKACEELQHSTASTSRSFSWIAAANFSVLISMFILSARVQSASLRLTTPPKHNGTTEQVWQTLFQTVCTLLLVSGLPRNLWGEVLQHIIYLYNQSAHSTLNGKLPFEACFGTALDIASIWVWGSWVFVHTHPAAISSPPTHLLADGLDST
jgi:hypothetical protein